MENFFIVNNNDGTYHIECLFVVYREQFGHHPAFLPQNEEKGKREGFNTKFYFLIEDNLNYNDAKRRLDYYRKTYNQRITDIENDDKKWDIFPFKNKPVVYSK